MKIKEYKEKYGEEMIDTNLAQCSPTQNGEWKFKKIVIPEWKYYMINDLLKCH